MTTMMRLPVAPGRWPVLGHTLALWRRPLEFLTALPAAGDLVEIRIGPQRMFVVCCPDLVHQVLRDGRTFDKGGPLYDQLSMVMGEGVGTCPHGPHQRQRRLLQPAFSRERLRVYAGEMSRQLDAALATWRDGQVIDVLAAMSEIAVKVLARTLVTATLSPDQSADLLHSVTAVLEGMFLRMVIPRFARALVPALRRFDRALSRFDTLTYEIIDTYRSDGVDHGDLMSMMLAARDEHGDALTDTEIRDQVVTFLVAGAESTATLLAWSLHLLALHPQIAQRVQEEADTVLAGRIATHDNMARLGYTTRVLTETLRLYPPAWMLTRKLTTQTTLAGQTLPAGATLVYSAYLIQRRGDLYPDPDRFDPDRWLSEHTAALPRGAFVAFGGGSRRCIGDSFAMLEATLALATITARWHLDPVPGMITKPHVRTALMPHPLRMRLRRRHA